MNTRFLMMASAVVLGTFGIICSFLPAESLHYLGIETQPILTLLLQVMGGLYMGMAVLNWMGRGNLIGGIYSRPVALGNFAHFMIAGLAGVKWAFAHAVIPSMMIVIILYVVFAVLFGWILFRHPLA